MTLAELTSSRPWVLLGWTMVHMLWLGALIGLFALAGRALLRRADPALRYGFALGCFVLLLLAPVVLLAWQWGETAPPSRTNWWAGLLPQVFGGAMPAPAAWSWSASAPLSSGWQSVPLRQRWADLAGLFAQAMPWLWLCGAPLALALMARSAWRLRHLQRQLVAAGAPGELAARCEQLAQRLGLSCTVRVAVCERLAAPSLLGILRPVLVLPASALTGLSPQQLEMVLLHELVHVARRDNLVILIQRVAEAVLFFHPAVWWLSSWLTAERELCCDARVVGRTGHPELYVRTLLAFAEASSTHHASALSSSMAQGGLLRRAARLLDKEKESMSPLGPSGGLTAVMAIASACLLGAAQAVPAHAAPSPFQVGDSTAPPVVAPPVVAPPVVAPPVVAPPVVAPPVALSPLVASLPIVAPSVAPVVTRDLWRVVVPSPPDITVVRGAAANPQVFFGRRHVPGASPSSAGACTDDEHCAGCPWSRRTVVAVPGAAAPSPEPLAWVMTPAQPAAAPKGPCASAAGCCRCPVPKSEDKDDSPEISWWRSGEQADDFTPQGWWLTSQEAEALVVVWSSQGAAGSGFWSAEGGSPSYVWVTPDPDDIEEPGVFMVAPGSAGASYAWITPDDAGAAGFFVAPDGGTQPSYRVVPEEDVPAGDSQLRFWVAPDGAAPASAEAAEEAEEAEADTEPEPSRGTIV